ncbi:leishmanolysin-like peptidase [Brachionus plicatilis]|uniref:Leishmanolysin-like peptidase n=1 Tax=Brachionus plicatilis TaxID=10195 RepID=A0A3M7RCC6_BRAPC|nr:leishmanolysin-like peptidase [Brachionus plicatilis]
MIENNYRAFDQIAPILITDLFERHNGLLVFGSIMVELKLLIVSFIALYSFAQIIECLPVRKKKICHFLPENEKLLFSNFKRRNHPRSKNYRHIPFYINKELSYDEPTNLIIHTHYDKSFYDFPSNILKLYKDYLIPEAIKYWENSLKVKYRYFPILLGRSCVNLQLVFDDSTKSVACETDCSETTKCGDYITIPEEHLDTCKYCVNNKSCTNRGKQKGGIKADFILYISAIDSRHCNASNTVAFASYCQLESKYNRPVGGYVNICPHSVSTKKSDIDPALATLKHEILHALGFSAGLFGFFLDANGNPLTERNPSTGKPPFNTKTNMYEASSRVVQNVKRSNWKIGNKRITRNIKMLITPKVLAEVRKHFNCSTLEGAELEDQGDIGTRLTHWEKRVFENEAMTGTYTQNSVFSKITFAFLEDTGWYIANYSMAEELRWGSNLGCDFVKKSCKSWMDSRREKNLSIQPFCDYIPANENVNTKYECNEQRDAVLLCNMVEYSHEIPTIYRNFDSYYHQNHSHAKNWLPRYSFSHLGGSVALADYCPFMQQVSWSMNNEIRDSRCIYEENSPDKSKNYILENYGSKSKCFSHSRSWLIYTNECTSRITVSKTIGCYQVIFYFLFKI